MRTSIAVLAGVVALLAVSVTPAVAKPGGPNGQIAFGRFDPLLGDTVFYTINPDGTHERQLLPLPLECPRWSPDGTRIASCGGPDSSATAIIDPDDGSYRELFAPDPTLLLACFVWSPDGGRLACEQFDAPVDTTRGGIYSIRSTDGGGLTRITSSGDAHDNPGDYSPNRKQLVFARSDHDGDPLALFVAMTNG